jgi:AcrR family transcriptional regulator
MKKAKLAKPKRIRRTPENLRAEAMAAARRLIVEGSGETLTMRAVADAIGVTYPNLSHHFGSAAGLHAAVAEELVGELLQALDAGGREFDTPLADPRRVVDLFFDLYEREGLGKLMGWIARAGNEGLTDRVRDMVDAHVTRAEGRFEGKGEHVRELFPQVALLLTLTAYAEASVGTLLGEALGLPAERRREIVAWALGAMKSQLTEM